MTPDDLARLHARCIAIPPPFSAADFKGLLDTPGVFLFGDAKGLALGRVAADEAELLTLAVAPEARRQGLGRHWLSAFEAGALDRGAVHAFLEVAEDNAPAQALYAAHGWTEVGRRRGYYAAAGGRSTDALVLSKSLRAQG